MAVANIKPEQMRHFGFLLLPHFSMVAVVNAIELLRLANYVSGRELYRWTLIDSANGAADASNGLRLGPGIPAARAGDCDIVLACAGLRLMDVATSEELQLLRALAARGQPLGALCTGTYLLAKSGLIDGYRCTISWESIPAMRERFPKVDFRQELFVIDRGLVTCSGGTASIDLMLNIVHRQHGGRLALDVSQQFNIERIRDDKDQQRAPLMVEGGPGREVVTRAASLMESKLDGNLSMEEVAEQVGLSLRQLERLFKLHLKTSPRHYFLELRLRRARNLLRQTGMSVMEVTLACGFQSSSHFCTAYRELFGHPPSAERGAASGPAVWRERERRKA